MATWHALALSSSSRHLAKSVLRSNTTSCQMVSYLRTSACCSGRRKMPNSERKGANTTTSDPSSLFIPIPVKHNPDDINIGAELAPGPKLEKQDLMKMLTKFFQRDEVRNLCRQEGLDNTLYHQAYISFRRFCLESEVLPPELHIVFSDVLQGAGHVDDIFPYFLKHAKLMFPHLSCIGELKQISDLRNPVNWYPEARAISRRVIFHAGPTNSGKTYHALESFLKAKSGIYCGPLKLLAQEVFRKSNERGTPCDLVTGEEQRRVDPEGKPANHVACTVEMTQVGVPYEVAVIDEIQMAKDRQRGWAWTRAFLGICAEEIHVCGEAAAIEIFRIVCEAAGDELEVRHYERLTQMELENKALRSLANVQPGDCIVCFSKNDIYSCTRAIERQGKEVAVIYGGLPPGTKLAQAAKFNDPDNPCKILVSTDAIGMGLNLSIRRIIFFSLVKPNLNEDGEKEMEVLSSSQALQIAGRAGRYGTQFDKGYVTTFKNEDLPILRDLLSRPPERIDTIGLHPTADQIELYAYHLPQATLSNLMDIFVSLCTMDNSRYFLCNVDDFKFLADMIQHVPLNLRSRYVFCCAPINKKMPLLCTMFLKFARQYSRNEPMTYDFLCQSLGAPFSPIRNIMELVHMEAVFDCLDLYLWLSYRFPDMFLDIPSIREMRQDLDILIQEGVFNITNLLKQSESMGGDISDEGEQGSRVKKRSTAYSRGRTHSVPSALRRDKEDETLSMPEETNSPLPSSAQGKGVAPRGGRTALQAEVGKKKRVKPTAAGVIGGGRLTQRLLDQGLITPRQLKELQMEWDKQKGKEDQDR